MPATPVFAQLGGALIASPHPARGGASQIEWMDAGRWNLAIGDAANTSARIRNFDEK
jgi:hypothetical protein